MKSESPPLNEFALIERFFNTSTNASLLSDTNAITLGIGDDCALLNLEPQNQIAVTTDMLVEGRHFLPNANPEWLGHKALAVNLSDLAAMGASPLGFSLALALPKVDATWLAAFSRGLFTLAQQYECPLIGGDTTAGPLNICITAFGSIPKEQAIKRSGAMAGDDIWVSGTIGDARLTLGALRQEINLSASDLSQIESRMHQPNPRINLGLALRGIAHAAIDVSDGLLGDLQHILRQSHQHAIVFLDQLPKSATLLKQEQHLQNQYAACGGDDYELCFTAPISQRAQIAVIGQVLNLALTKIGTVEPMANKTGLITLIDASGHMLGEQDTAALLTSFDHFA
jgi:thiamine-monophosphate kinase